MSLAKKYIGDVFLTSRLYWTAFGCIAAFILAFYFPLLFDAAKMMAAVLGLLVLGDYFFLFFVGKSIEAKRTLNERLSNGDENVVKIKMINNNPFWVKATVYDELPFQFQEREFNLKVNLQPGEEKLVEYTLRPVERGGYEFGNLLLYAQSRLGLLERRNTINAEQNSRVYPSFLQLGNYQLLSNTTMQQEQGSRRLRKIGQSMEFEQVKDYVTGDDIRTINWKATARKGGLMVNNYVDEKSQQVYCIIDKGRLMKMPFAGLSLLDYAINSVLALSSICLKKQDKIGLISFSNKMGTMLAADRKPIQRENILQSLYNEKTNFKESDFEMLYTQVRKKVKQRSLLVLFTNFESLSGLKRQLNYLRSIARHHLLLVIFFENTELHKLSNADAQTVDEVYVKTIAEKFVFEKKLIVKELQKYGILSVLTTPQNLTVNAINKYLELKARQAL